MTRLLPLLIIAMVLGLTATIFAALNGYGFLACVLVYSAAGQAVLILLVAADLLRTTIDQWVALARNSKGRTEGSA